jgi:hypothetical protein
MFYSYVKLLEGTTIGKKYGFFACCAQTSGDPAMVDMRSFQKPWLSVNQLVTATSCRSYMFGRSG